jgi:cardiolipin synthase C
MLIILVCASLLYITVSVAVIFYYHKPTVSNYKETHSVDRFYGENTTQDRVILLEEKSFSALARIHLLENAEESIDVAYYTIHEGYIADLLLGMIFDAADRGVKVRILLDGMFHNLRGNFKDVLYAFIQHPNIEIKFYETFKPLKPWTWNNRMHDKILVIDQKYAVIGGRNIGNRYFIQDGDKAPTNDRDVLVINTDLEKAQSSAVYQMNTYFNQVWDHPFSEFPLETLSKRQQQKALKMNKEMQQKLHKLQESDPSLFKNTYDWLKMSLPTKKVTLVHNPIQRFNKEPWIWYDLTNLMKSAKESITIQSPYIIPTKQMQEYVEPLMVKPEKITFLTNSIASSPNVMAFSGYTNYREGLAKQGANLYEYQGPDSLHAKTFVYDNRLVAIGAFNVDSRSAFLNTETMVVIDSVEFAEKLGKELDYYFSKSLQLGADGNYLENQDVKKGEASFIKSITIKVLSYITRLFEHLV